MGRFDGMACDGPGCASVERVPTDRDYPSGWYLLYGDEEEGKQQEFMFCNVSCLARWSNRRDAGKPRPKIILGGPQPVQAQNEE